MTPRITFRSHGACPIIWGHPINITSLRDQDRFPADCFVTAHKSNTITEHFLRKKGIDLQTQRKYTGARTKQSTLFKLSTGGRAT